MDSIKLVALNIKWYRYEQNITQEKLAELTGFKIAYVSIIETADINITCKTIDTLANALNVPVKLLFDETTAEKAKTLPSRVDMYKSTI